MRQRSVWVVVAAMIISAGCNGNAPTGTPSGPTEVNGLGSCTTLFKLTSLAWQVYGGSSAGVQPLLAKLDTLKGIVAQGDSAGAQAAAKGIVTWVEQQAMQATLPGKPAEINNFIGSVLCYAGLSQNTYLVQPSADTQVVMSSSGNSGVLLGPGTVDVPTMLTINELDPNGPSGLDTKLDQYPTFLTISSSSPLMKPVVVAVCISASLQVPDDVFQRLRIGHQASSGFEITPPADPSFLGCPSSSASSRLPKWLRTLADLVLPAKLYARTLAYGSGGVGGSATEFSPFGAVDNALFASGGVGGSATEFKLGSKVPNQAFAAQGDNCLSADTTAGEPLNPLCRPVVTIHTAQGTPFIGVPLSWNVTAGGGSIAPDTLGDNACGTFGSAASNATDTDGKAGVCWTLGPDAGTNVVTAMPTPGGDAPEGVIFVDGNGNQESGVTFTATGDPLPSTASASDVTVPFDGMPHPGSGSCSNGVTPTLTYGTKDGSPPVAAGTYPFTATCNAGSPLYQQSKATATITIDQSTPSVALSCPESEPYTGAPLTPCTATITGPGLNFTATPTYTDNVGVGTATASYTYTGSGDLGAVSGSATFQITPAATVTTVNCANATYTGSAITNVCDAVVTGPGGLDQPVAPITYGNNVLAGTASASAAYAGGGNWLPSSGAATFQILQAATVTVVTCSNEKYTGSPITNACTAKVTGPGGLDLPVVPITYTNNVAIGTANASATYPGGSNWLSSTGAATFKITPAQCPATMPSCGQ